MATTLEKMQAAGLEVDDAEPTTPTEAIDEPELVLDDDDSAVVADESEEGTLVLQGEEQPHPRKVEVPKQTLSELRRTRREAREQVAEKDSELQQLRQEMAELRRTVTPRPKYADFRSDEDYEAAVIAYHQQVGKREEAPQQAQAPQRPNQPAQAQAPDYSDAVNAHIDRVEKLGVSATQYKQADQSVRAVFGDSVTDALIASVGEGSEIAMLAMGTRPEELAKVQRLLMDDPTGLKTVAYLGRLSARASFKSKKTISDAPSPTRSPTGGGHLSANAKAFQKKLDAAEKAGDVQQMVTLRRQQRQAERAAASK
jgi:hypothetical protein